MWLVLLILGVVVNASQPTQQVASLFENPEPNSTFNHLAVDHNTGQIYVGAVNSIYQLSPNLEVVQKVATGPGSNTAESGGCTNCTAKDKVHTDNVNKALLIDYPGSRLIACGSAEQGLCSVRSLNNISLDFNEARVLVVADTATASTVAFIAPGPPNPPTTQVMYLGVTYTGTSEIRSDIPAVSSRSLENDRLFNIAADGNITGSRIFVNSLSREHYPINYVYGFSAEGFSYFLTTQLIAVGSDKYYSKLVRVCQDDENYYSYMEVPIYCTSGGSSNYNLVQAAFVGKVGSDLANDLGITTDDDVLFAAFSQSEPTNSNTPAETSAICVYSLKDIRSKFLQNIKLCFSGKGSRGLDFISPSSACIPTKFESINEDFCGLDVNTPLGGEQPVVASPVTIFKNRLTAVAVTTTGGHTVVFAGTVQGHLKKIVVETATSAFEYDDIVIQEGSSVNKDLFFDPHLLHLYVATEHGIFKVKVQDCSVYESCSDCLKAKDPYCGWCSLENKCSIRSGCKDAEEDPLYWTPFKTGQCSHITQVSPPQIDLSAISSKSLSITLESIPKYEGKLLCVFKALGSITKVTAKVQNNVVECETPTADMLPKIPYGEHHITTKLSIGTNHAPDFAATKFTFYDCNTYTSCKQCVTSSFSCNWCLDSYSCTSETNKDCKISINAVGSEGSRVGPDYCPTLQIPPNETNEILIPNGIKEAIKVKINLIKDSIPMGALFCKLNVETRSAFISAKLVGDTITCDPHKFIYTSDSPTMIAPLVIMRDVWKPLDNPDKIHVLIYRCDIMASDKNSCIALPSKYNCGWCQGSDKCEVKELCYPPNKWLNRTHFFPEINSFKPEVGPWEGGTKITIEGTNFGYQASDIDNITIAGIKCHPIVDLYVENNKIVCTVDGAGSENLRHGLVVIHVANNLGESKHEYAFVNPKLTSIEPKFGPQSGRTRILIKGEQLNAGSNITSYIDDLPCAITSIADEEITCITSPSNNRKTGTLRMQFDNGLRSLEQDKFEYLKDPTITSAQSGPSSGILLQRKELKSVPSGGLNIKVKGQNFNSIQSPLIYVINGNHTYFAPCHEDKDGDANTNLICVSPTIENADLDLDPYNPLELEYGFYMNDVKSVQNLKSKTGKAFLLYPDPTYETFANGIKFYRSGYLTITGKNLDWACTTDDVEVKIGESTCSVTSISRTQLTCRPPSKDKMLAGVDPFDVVVKVGKSLSYMIGKLSYSSKSSSLITLPVDIGIAVAKKVKDEVVDTIDSVHNVTHDILFGW